MINLTLPICLISPNRKEHWGVLHKRNKLLKVLVKLHLKEVAPVPCTVEIVRHCKRFFDDDNLVTSCKGLRDAIAEAILPGLAAGRADGDERITWLYSQKKSDKICVEVIINGR